jgi:hypothetical protein
LFELRQSSTKAERVRDNLENIGSDDLRLTLKDEFANVLLKVSSLGEYTAVSRIIAVPMSQSVRTFRAEIY